MKSIRGNFALLTLVSTLLLSLIIGTVSVTSLVRQAETDATTTMNLTCENESNKIDAILEGVEDAIGIQGYYVMGRLMAMQQAGPTWYEDELNEQRLMELQMVFKGIAESTEGSLMYYLLLDNPDNGEEKGFVFGRGDSTAEYVRLPDFSTLPAYRGVGKEAGWDEARLRRGESLWIEPELVQETNSLVALYVQPVLVKGEYVGSVGMGVDFQIVINQVASMNSFQTGYGFLTDAAGNVMYHPTIPYGTNLSEDDEEVPEVDRAIELGTTEDIVRYQYHGADKRMAFHLLRNDMRLVLSVDAKEIYAQRDSLIRLLIGVTAAAAVILSGVSFVLGRRVLAPLNRLTAAAKRVADGDLDVEILSSDTEEVSNLIEAYQRTVADLREQLDYINGLAHRDGLTGVFNKSAYTEERERLDAAIASGDAELSFALVMLDVNNLKDVNDTYGHETGDEYLRVAATQVMAGFEGCPVYRIGGDEFVVLLEGPLVGKASEGLVYLKEVMRVSADIDEPWRRTSLAYGVAEYDSSLDDGVSSVFERADAAMYGRKQEMKREQDTPEESPEEMQDTPDGA